VKNERFGAPADHHNTTGQFNPAVHGFEGINTVSLGGFPTDIDARVFTATDELAEFPFNLDMNSGDTIGVGACRQLRVSLLIIRSRLDAGDDQGRRQEQLGHVLSCTGVC
jgi:hypothetical protein